MRSELVRHESNGDTRDTSDRHRPSAPYGGARPFALPREVARAVGIPHIYTVFQPIIDLRSACIVGFEALTRGPEGSDLESPLAILEAARHRGLIGEIDWVCRAAAVRTALESDLPANLTWFINVEPDGLDNACPKYLFSIFRKASRLRIVLEIVERGCENHWAELLELAAIARRNGWGIALDDVGVNDESLALLPVLEPDIVKLDGSLLDPVGNAGAVVVNNALRSHSEARRPLHVLAETIERREQLEVATEFFGARYGQGFRFGRPGPLPRNILPPTEPIEITEVSAARDSDDPRRSQRSMIGRHSTTLT